MAVRRLELLLGQLWRWYASEDDSLQRRGNRKNSVAKKMSADNQTDSRDREMQRFQVSCIYSLQIRVVRSWRNKKKISFVFIYIGTFVILLTLTRVSMLVIRMIRAGKKLTSNLSDLLQLYFQMATRSVGSVFNYVWKVWYAITTTLLRSFGV